MKRKKKIKRIFFTVLLAAGVILAVLLMYGGEGLRWFGQKSQDVGDSIRRSSEALGDRADELKDDVENKADDLKEDVSKKAGKIKKDVKNTVSGD